MPRKTKQSQDDSQTELPEVAATAKPEAAAAPKRRRSAATAADRPVSQVVRAERVAIVDALRSPFTRAWSTLNDVDPVQLSTSVARELLFRNELPAEALDEIIWGTVITVPTAPNVAREIALDLGMFGVPGYTVTRACATGFQSVASAARMIQSGEARAVLAGGVDVTSHAPVVHRKAVIDLLLKAQKQKGLAMLQTLAQLNPLDLLPKAPAIAERYTGKTMGEHAELMAQGFEISRASQEDLALRSHRDAAAAIAAGHIAPGVATIQTPKGPVHEDNLIRGDMDAAKIAKLKPVFDRRNGSITAATSSALTDGAAGVLVMSESRAKELGYEPLGFLRSFHFAALDPRVNLLLGNAYSVPFALQKAGVQLGDVGVVEVHEAFAAQVLSNLKCMADAKFCQDELGLGAAVGEVDPARLNQWGGSLAYGHPFAATGGRMVRQTLDLMRHRDAELGLATACAAGGLGVSMIFERG